VVLKRLMDDRYETFRLKLPIAMSVTKDINVPRVQSLRGKMKAKKAEIPVWTKEDIGMAEEELGLLGSTTRVIKIFTSKIEKDTEVFEGSTEEKVEKLYSKLQSLHIV
jgi:electron transfer flavoprotein beta subunit